jgi:hypothetical protein
MRWKHPQLGQVGPIRKEHQAEKVWKHLYNPSEQWAALTTSDLRHLRQEALRTGGLASWSLGAPPYDWRLRRVLEQHHDAAFAPAYMAELGDGATLWGAKQLDAARWVGRTPNAVIGIVLTAPTSRVLTAYRPHPPVVNVDWREEDFQRQADYVFEKETAMDTPSTRRLIQELRRTSEVGWATTMDVWWLTFAVAQARARVGTAPELQDSLAVAERALDSASRDIREELVQRLHLEAMLDRLAAGLQENEPEGVEQALSDIEDTLLVLDVLGAGSELATLLDGASSLMAWTPAAFTTLTQRALYRRALYVETSAVAALWDAVEESVIGASVRDTPPSRRPAATLVDVLLPRPSLADRLAAWAARGADESQAWIHDQLAILEVRSLAPVMGRGVPPTEPFVVVGHLRSGPRCLRGFAIDEEYPDGHDVTELVMAPGRSLWQLERPGQEVVIVLFATDTPMVSATLSGLFDEAERRGDVTVGTRRLSRPNR